MKKKDLLFKTTTETITKGNKTKEISVKTVSPICADEIADKLDHWAPKPE